jgi:cytochrome d ubiquinol oxidase subunit I
MVLSGLWMMLVAALGAFFFYKKRLEENPFILKLLLWSLPFPYIANSTGWILTEGGRQPWIVVGLQKVSEGVSTNVTSTEIWISMIGFTVLYGALAAAAIYLVRKFIIIGPVDEKPVLSVLTKKKEATLWN